MSINESQIKARSRYCTFNAVNAFFLKFLLQVQADHHIHTCSRWKIKGYKIEEAVPAMIETNDSVDFYWDPV